MRASTVSFVAGDAGQDQGLGAVVPPQRRRRTQAPVRDGLLDARGAVELGGEIAAGSGDRIVVDRAPAGSHQEDEVGVAGVEDLVDDVAGLGGLGRRVLEPAGGEVLLDSTTDDAGQHEEDGRRHEDPAPPTDGETTQPCQHAPPLGAVSYAG